MMTQRRNIFARRGSPLRRIALGVAMLLPLAGCDEVLDVTDPDVADPSGFTDATALPAIQAGALGDFKVAYVGTTATEGQILVSGLLGDEWFHSGTFPTRAQVDIRSIQPDNATVQAVTRNLYRARRAAEAAIQNFEQLGPNTAGHALALNLAGFTYTLFGENYCSGVPFSELNPDGTFTFGGQETTTQVFERALDRANRAIEVATAAGTGAAATAQLNAARVLKGRVLLNLGRFQEAAAAVAQVPTAFNYQIITSENTTREQNAVWVFNAIVERWSVPDREGGNGLPYRTHRVFSPTSADSAKQDPRVPWRILSSVNSAGNRVFNVGFDGTTLQFDNLKYPNRSAPVPITNGIEARLIEAEAALRNNNTAAFLTNLNLARAQAAASVPTSAPAAGGTLPALTAADIPADMAGRVDLLFAERAYDLWLTSHRLGDMRRLIRQYGRPANRVFPEGEYHKNVLGGVYGEDVNLPIFVDEKNNPEFAAFPEGNLCLNRDA